MFLIVLDLVSFHKHFLLYPDFFSSHKLIKRKLLHQWDKKETFGFLGRLKSQT